MDIFLAQQVFLSALHPLQGFFHEVLLLSPISSDDFAIDIGFNRVVC
jgi:hypothetical protein